MTQLVEKRLSEIKSLREEAEYLESTICEFCEGDGQVMGKVYGNEISPPYKNCPNCKGTGIKQ